MTTEELIKEIATNCKVTEDDANEMLHEEIDYTRIDVSAAGIKCLNEIARRFGIDIYDIVEYMQPIKREEDTMSGCPLWYGIPEMRFVWHGEWADCGICYDGMFFNGNEIEEYFWENYNEDYPQGNKSDDEYNEEFVKYMRDHESEIKGFCEQLLYDYIQEYGYMPEYTE